MLTLHTRRHIPEAPACSPQKKERSRQPKVTDAFCLVLLGLYVPQASKPLLKGTQPPENTPNFGIVGVTKSLRMRHSFQGPAHVLSYCFFEKKEWRSNVEQFPWHGVLLGKVNKIYPRGRQRALCVANNTIQNKRATTPWKFSWIPHIPRFALHY